MASSTRQDFSRTTYVECAACGRVLSTADGHVCSKGGVPNEAAKAASDYFNSLPIEERRKLVPLLDDYRRMGMEEAAGAFKVAARKVDDRIRSIDRVRSIA